MVGPPVDAAPTFVLLHEGLGCAARWRDFPERLAGATGMGVFAYSRAGYGSSTPAPLPRPLTYMEDEARRVLPRVLDVIGFRSGVLLGHSDGASIAAVYAGEARDERVRGLVLIAPHFFTEDHGIQAIHRAREAYERGDLRARLARWHDHVDNAFYGWNRAWLDPDFRRWDISGSLPGVRVPVLVLQGDQDEYGTERQIEAAERLCGGGARVARLKGVGHMPQRDAAERVLEEVAAFVKTCGLTP